MADMQLFGSYPSAPDRQLAGAPLDLPEAGLPSPGRIKVELRPLDTYFNASSSIPNREVAEKYPAFLKLANAAGLLTGKSHAGSVSSSRPGSTGSSPLSSPRAIPRCHNPEPSSPIPLEGVHRAKSYSSSATGKGGSYMQRAKSYGSIAAAAAAAKGHHHDSKQVSGACVVAELLLPVCAECCCQRTRLTLGPLLIVVTCQTSLQRSTCSPVLQASPAPVTSDANTSNSSACGGRAEAMQAAYEALNRLSKNDITEIKRMKNPPSGEQLGC